MGEIKGRIGKIDEDADAAAIVAMSEETEQGLNERIE